MSAQDNRDSGYITEVRTLNRIIWNAVNDLVDKQIQWNALDYANTLPDGAGENEGITRAMVGPVVFDTANALAAVMATNAANMAGLL